jgi:hypothetical protein
MNGEFDLPCKAAFRRANVSVVARVSWAARLGRVVVFGRCGSGDLRILREEGADFSLAPRTNECHQTCL